MELIVKVTVPVVCNNGNSCLILVHMKTDNSDGLLNACTLEFKPGLVNQSQVVKVAAKRDFILDGTKLMRLTFNISREGSMVDWEGHYQIPPVLVCIQNDLYRCLWQVFALYTSKKTSIQSAKLGKYLLSKNFSLWLSFLSKHRKTIC